MCSVNLLQCIDREHNELIWGYKILALITLKERVVQVEHLTKANHISILVKESNTLRSQLHIPCKIRSIELGNLGGKWSREASQAMEEQAIDEDAAKETSQIRRRHGTGE